MSEAETARDMTATVDGASWSDARVGVLEI
jgi:hypothetical protein